MLLSVSISTNDTMFTRRGLYTALITPFTASGELDIETYLQLIDMQIASGVDGVVICGSTGEGATTSADEKLQLFRWAVERAAGRIAVIAGTGSNDTRASIDLSRRAKDLGVDALLLVTPFYNKPTPAGQVAHFCAISEAVDLPQIMYNVPGRTATNMSAATQLEIAHACPNVVATKEASANLEQISEIASGAPSHFTVFAGDDSLTLPTISVGGTGVIAVISNYVPKLFGSLVRSALAGDLASAQRVQKKLMPFYKANFLESNPVPVKYIMHKKHGVNLTYRLPLTPPTAATRKALDEIIATIDDTAAV